MDVTCERCGTEYEFDETLVAARGTTVKCTNCGHLFKVFRPGAAAGASAEPRSWTVQRAGSPPETIASLKELQRLITIGQLTPDDRISRSGEGWKRLGDIAELQTFFAAARAAREPRPRRDSTGRNATGGRVTDKRAYAPTAEGVAPASERPPARAGKSTMLGVGPSSAPPPRATPSGGGASSTPAGRPTPGLSGGRLGSDRPIASDARGRTVEAAIPPPATNGVPVPSPRAQPSATSPGGHRAPGSSAGAPPRAGPPSRPPPAGIGDGSGPLPRPARMPVETMPEMPAPAAERERLRSGKRLETPMPTREGERPSVRALRVDDDDDIPLREPVRSRSGLWVGLVVVTAIALGVVAGWDRINALIAGDQSDPVAPFLAEGDSSLRLDHEDGYEDAIAHFTKALAFREHEPRALAGISRAHALLAQDLLFDASDVEARAGDDPALRAEAAAMRREAREHVEEAREQAHSAAQHAVSDADVEIALADAMRLAGDATLARSRLDRARTLASAPSAEALRVEALLEADDAGSIAAASTAAARAVEADPSLVRARLVLARARLASGDVAGARTEIDAVLGEHGDHPRATALRDAIDRGVPPASVTAGVDGGIAAEGRPNGASPTAAGSASAPAAPSSAASTTTAGTTTPAATTTTARTGTTPATTPSTTAASTSTATTPRATATSTGGTATAASSSSGGPRGYEALLREADQRLEYGDVRRARALYEQALRDRPGSAEASTGLGFVMLADGNARAAIEHFQRAGATGHADAYIGLGDAYRRLGQREDALGAYEAYLDRSPGGARASIARRQAERLRSEIAAAGGTFGGGSTGTSGSGSSTGGSSSGGSGSGGSGSPAPETAPQELPGPRGSTSTPPQDTPALEHQP
jgi:predicted Zn finger-like uncharacterized protein